MYKSLDKGQVSNLHKNILHNAESQKYGSLMKDRKKEGKFLLDCTNMQQSKLPNYNYLRDKYLTYFIVRIPKKVRMEGTKQQKKMELNSKELKRFIQKKKDKILKQNRNLPSQHSLQKQNKKEIIKTKQTSHSKEMNFKSRAENSPVKWFKQEEEEEEKITKRREQLKYEINTIHCKSPSQLILPHF